MDGAALLAAGAWNRRGVLVLAGGVFLAASILVLLSWSWYRRRLEEIAAVRKALAEDTRQMLADVRGSGAAGKRGR
jgi:HAMP domain-containing protein